MPAGPGIRVDTAGETGARVPPEYDNLVAKIMVVADDRPAAIERLRLALDETGVAGIQTTLPFHRFVARHASFGNEDLSIDWVEEHWDGETRRRDALALAVGVAARAFDAAGAAAAPPDPPAGQPTRGGWRASARAAGIDRWPR